MTDLSHKTVVGIGELLWDCFEDSRRPGGAPANVTFHAGQLGLRGVACSRVGDDGLGEELIRYLHDHGLSTEYVQRDRRHPTGTVTVETKRADQPTYTIHEDVAWDHLAFDAVVSNLMAMASAVCFGTLAQRSPRSRRTIQTALDACGDTLTVYDVNLRPPHYDRKTIEHSLERAAVVKLNSDEVSTVAEMTGSLSDDPEEFAYALMSRFSVRQVWVTRGANGCLAVSKKETVDIPGRPIELVDPVGAGDAFTAAMTYGLLSEWPLERTARFANEVGALVAGRAGAMPLLIEELCGVMSEILVADASQP